MKEIDLRPPQVVSNDGKEIWAWAAKLAKLSGLQHKIRILNEDIQSLNPRCGSCTHWMKSNICPREVRTPQGRRSGPSANGFICNQFVEESWVTELRKKRLEELETVKQLLIVETENNDGDKH